MQTYHDETLEQPGLQKRAGPRSFTEFRPTTVLVGDEIIAVEYRVSAESPSGKSVSTPMIAVFDVDEKWADLPVHDRL